MSIGAFGENFPYTNFHDMNLDWLIKIAKDFLDQYTHIQEVIEQGLADIDDKTQQGITDLQDKYNTLEEALNSWYETHSADIADQLADALEDLNDWYTEHQGYLDDYLESSEATFTEFAEAKGQSVIDSIPADYSAFYAMFGSAFDNTATYDAGDIVIYDSKLYRAKQNIAAGSFNSSEWTQIKCATQLGDIIGRIINTDSEYAIELANGTDFNDITGIGNYKVRTYAAAQTMSNMPSVNAGRLTVFRSSQTSGTGLFQMYIANSNDLRLYFRHNTNSGWSYWNKVLIESDVTALINSNTMPYKLRLMQYNLGQFNKGFDHNDTRGIDQDRLPEYIGKFKAFMGKYQPDICGFEEYTEYIDKSDSDYPADDLFSPLYKYSSELAAKICVKANYAFTSDTYKNINLPDDTSIAILRETPITIRGKHFIILTGHFRVAMSSEYHIQGFQDLMDYADNYDNVIIMVDSNFHDETERNAITAIAGQHDFKIANHGYFGDFDTLQGTTSYRPIDSIYVKGTDIFMINTFMPEEGPELMSDHNPIITDIHII